jgi:undecaprenyl-diphosphatase
MLEWVRAIVLGLIQGVTEFLPISSDGHLSLLQILSSGWIDGGSETGADHVFFDVMLHVGTMVAILVHYRKQIAAGLRGLAGRVDVPAFYQKPALLRLAGLVFVALLPLLPVVKFKDQIEETYSSLWAVGFGFLTTAVVLLVTHFLRGGKKGPDTMTWVDALLIGCAQAIAPLPGVSRSGLTIAMALIRGLTKSWSVGFSLAIAVPAITGATILQLRKLADMHLSESRIAQILVASTLAGVVGYAAILWLLRIVRSERLWWFSIYLFVLSAVILFGLAPRQVAITSPAPASSPGEARQSEPERRAAETTGHARPRARDSEALPEQGAPIAHRDRQRLFARPQARFLRQEERFRSARIRV